MWSANGLEISTERSAESAHVVVSPKTNRAAQLGAATFGSGVDDPERQQADQR